MGLAIMALQKVNTRHSRSLNKGNRLGRMLVSWNQGEDVMGTNTVPEFGGGSVYIKFIICEPPGTL